MLKYKVHAENNSLYNTPPTYGIYICSKVFKWIEDLGGLESMQKINEEKAAILYDYLDSSKLFKGTVGGMRASIYNAMPIEGVKALVEFMKNFEIENITF